MKDGIEVEICVYANHCKYINEIYNKALDDFVNNFDMKISESIIWGIVAGVKALTASEKSDEIIDYVMATVKKNADELKAGGKDEIN